MDKGLLRGLRAAVLLFCSFLPFMAGTRTARAQESFVFSFPSIPDTLTAVDARAAYLVSHYWDRASFPSALSSADNDSIEQAWVNYCDLFGLVDGAVVEHSLSTVVSEGHFPVSARIFLMSLAEKYFFDSDSPYCSDAAYLCVLKACTACTDIDKLYQERYASHLRMLMGCREGSVAADFRFRADNSISSTLYQLSSPHTLLLLYNPDCDYCRSMMNWVETNPQVASLCSDGKLLILSVNVGESAHASTGGDGHRNWIDAHDSDANILKSNLYDLRTLPLCLLLDADKKIVGKMATVSELEQKLRAVLE